MHKIYRTHETRNGAPCFDLAALGHSQYVRDEGGQTYSALRLSR